MSSIKQIAAVAGVSKSTVSNVFVGNVPVREETRRKVLTAAEQLGYRPHGPAQTLRTGRSKVLGLCVAFITSPTVAPVIQGAANQAYAEGFAVSICALDSNADLERKHADVLLGQRAAAVVSYASSNDPAAYLELQRAGVPVVFIGSRPCGIAADLIMPDFRAAMLSAVRHLIDGGRRRIGLLIGAPERETSLACVDGYRTAHAEAGRTILDDLIVVGLRCTAEAYGATEALLHVGVDALVAGLPSLTLGAVSCLCDRGIAMPEQVAFLGSGDTGWARLVRPPLTMMEVDSVELGRRAMAMAMERLNPRLRDAPPREVCLPIRLEIRASSLGPPAAEMPPALARGGVALAGPG
jgi:LacI family transcriptional regulator